MILYAARILTFLSLFLERWGHVFAGRSQHEVGALAQFEHFIGLFTESFIASSFNALIIGLMLIAAIISIELADNSSVAVLKNLISVVIELIDFFELKLKNSLGKVPHKFYEHLVLSISNSYHNCLATYSKLDQSFVESMQLTAQDVPGVL